MKPEKGHLQRESLSAVKKNTLMADDKYFTDAYMRHSA